jgi:predicted RNase H-like HicB family nuclease
VNVRLLIHLEPVPDHETWWIESPDVPGFTGAADTLQEARLITERAIREMLDEKGEHEVTFSYDFVMVEGSAGDAIAPRRLDDAGEGPMSSAPLAVSRVA